MIRNKNICIIGVGLIGGSLGLALKKRELAKKIIGFGRTISKLKAAVRLGAIDEFSLDLKEAVCGSDIIVIATPVGKIVEFAGKVFKAVKPGAIVIDAGSTKSDIINRIEKIIPKAISFVGCHPLAGSEKSGVRNSKKNLFDDSQCIITPTSKTSKAAVKVASNIWRSAGCEVVVMSASKHDKILSAISHLPHIISVALVHAVSKDDFKFAASGLRDTTRIASSVPVVWRDICLSNKTNILGSIKRYKKFLNRIERNIRAGKPSSILREFKSAKEKRDTLLKNNT